MIRSEGLLGECGSLLYCENGLWMTIYWRELDATRSWDQRDFREGLEATLQQLGQPKRVLAIP